MRSCDNAAYANVGHVTVASVRLNGTCLLDATELMTSLEAVLERRGLCGAASDASDVQRLGDMCDSNNYAYNCLAPARRKRQTDVTGVSTVSISLWTPSGYVHGFSVSVPPDARFKVVMPLTPHHSISSTTSRSLSLSPISPSRTQ